jgi:hypothetical protein
MAVLTGDPLPRCPHCGSEEISKPVFSRRALAWGLLLFGFPLFFWRKVRHCFDCGADLRRPK